ncbi:hypothetical protein D043_0520A, partial [Vibrio parahaemolyticus EKP-021]
MRLLMVEMPILIVKVCFVVVALFYI